MVSGDRTGTNYPRNAKNPFWTLFFHLRNISLTDRTYLECQSHTPMHSDCMEAASPSPGSKKPDVSRIMYTFFLWVIPF